VSFRLAASTGFRCGFSRAFSFGHGWALDIAVVLRGREFECCSHPTRLAIGGWNSITRSMFLGCLGLILPMGLCQNNLDALPISFMEHEDFPA